MVSRPAATASAEISSEMQIPSQVPGTEYSGARSGQPVWCRDTSPSPFSEAARDQVWRSDRNSHAGPCYGPHDLGRAAAGKRQDPQWAGAEVGVTCSQEACAGVGRVCPSFHPTRKESRVRKGSMPLVGFLTVHSTVLCTRQAHRYLLILTRKSSLLLFK